jgi:hypothetical protein
MHGHLNITHNFSLFKMWYIHVYGHCGKSAQSYEVAYSPANSFGEQTIKGVHSQVVKYDVLIDV